uniref:Acyltransferase 3 domain-containing protein n=1 Tax=Chromera velia CCMP2878 TaxID=1169474 RepID=A0A0G4HYI3_9ALVE|eukprot:Cvel_9495.t1-p1 / transcript=Cvel_9495.t1 / gene=Cvel_9495 / organism=Chromera_velia_CCMP2878 / gene_product=hypothetical protein / transcript_product=hypothetical protein / location=Cvel_scaffold549:4572-5945(-) / protein_length=458 / sequence_SO=supercontig / SO=protein_coding / is_pseudo=false
MSTDDLTAFIGLRGVCAFAIMLGHQTDMFIQSPVKGQPVLIGLEYLQAVSLFFLLSGIPLTRLYSTTGKVETWAGSRKFWWKRFARLAPMYYITLALNVGICFLIMVNIDFTSLMESTVGCAFMLQAWFPSLINVGGVLWQIAVFMYGYLLFPFVSLRFQRWGVGALMCCLCLLYLLSLGLLACSMVFFPSDQWAGTMFVWHVHCLARILQVVCGMIVGEVIERWRVAPNCHHKRWAWTTDFLSFILLLTALQAPLVQLYFEPDVRSEVSIVLEALLLPVHLLWLAGFVLSFVPRESETIVRTESWTCTVLSWGPLVALGDISLVIYCLHLVVFFLYNSFVAFLTTGDPRLVPGFDAWVLRVLVPWYHMPLQWVLVVGFSLGVSRGVEAPLRRWLSGDRKGKREGGGGEIQREEIPGRPSGVHPLNAFMTRERERAAPLEEPLIQRRDEGSEQGNKKV